MSGTNELCLQVDDALAEVLDGTAPALLFDHIAECDECRDKKHDAVRAAELVCRRPEPTFERRRASRLGCFRRWVSAGSRRPAAPSRSLRVSTPRSPRRPTQRGRR